MKEKIEAIIAKHLKGFYSSVTERKNTFSPVGYLRIFIACAEWGINNVAGQKPQAVSLSLELDSMELTTQIFGGNGGGCIYRDPNMLDPKEKYLAMKSVKVPFRTPQKNETAVLKAFEKFVIAYKDVLRANIDVLRYRDKVNYHQLLNAAETTVK